jgi:hypothetical protein
MLLVRTRARARGARLAVGVGSEGHVREAGYGTRRSPSATPGGSECLLGSECVLSLTSFSSGERQEGRQGRLECEHPPTHLSVQDRARSTPLSWIILHPGPSLPSLLTSHLVSVRRRSTATSASPSRPPTNRPRFQPPPPPRASLDRIPPVGRVFFSSSVPSSNPQDSLDQSRTKFASLKVRCARSRLSECAPPRWPGGFLFPVSPGLR